MEHLGAIPVARIHDGRIHGGNRRAYPADGMLAGC
jgi:hypothetical protein